MWLEWKFGASIASCRLRPRCRWPSSGAELPLVLHVAAGRADRHVGLAVAEHERRRQRRARALARLERVGQALGEPEHLRARAHAEAEAGDDRGAVEPAAARGGGDEVAVAVGDVEVAGVAVAPGRASARSTPAPVDRRGGLRRQPRLAAVRGAGPQLERRPLADQRAPLVGVGARSAALERHVGEVRVAVPGLAVGEGELRALDTVCDVVGPGPSRRGRSRRAARAAGASPGPGPTGRSCRSCARGSRASPAPRTSPPSRARSSPVSSPSWRAPLSPARRSRQAPCLATQPR